MRSPKAILLSISIFLFIASLPMKTYCVDNDCGDYWNGLGTLLMGFLGIIFGKEGALSWLANPLIFIAWILPFRRINGKIICSLLATLLALYFLSIDVTLINEAGHVGTITGYASGYWLWTSSIVIYTIGLVYLYFIRRKAIFNEQ